MHFRDESALSKRARSPRHGSAAHDRFCFLFPGVVGARNHTMECRKGRRKGSPFLGGLLLAWLLSNGCAVVARNIGECRKLFTISRPARLPDTRERMQPRSPERLPPILAPIKGPVTTRADIYARHRRWRRDSPQAVASFASRRLPRAPFNRRRAPFKFSRR
jgi:hypothetical protein